MDRTFWKLVEPIYFLGRSAMKIDYAILLISLALVGCEHPIEIVGEGDVLSASGDRHCSLEQYEAASKQCTENLVIGHYAETYFAMPRSGWQFNGWGNYCDGLNAGPECHFNIPAHLVDVYWGYSFPPLTAFFRREPPSGFNALFMGHSFFFTFYAVVQSFITQSGFADHVQTTFPFGGFEGGATGIWDDVERSAAVKQVLDSGEIDLFGMTIALNPTTLGFSNWIEYALEQNENTAFFIGMPWLPDPGEMELAEYETGVREIETLFIHPLIDDLRGIFPGITIYCIPYGLAAVELKRLFESGDLPDVPQLVTDDSGKGVFSDSFGHPDAILVELGSLVWLNAIYGVDPSDFDYFSAHETDLARLAKKIVIKHDHHYDAL